jgi:hypothetical protein
VSRAGDGAIHEWGEYLAGKWKMDLIRQLCWYISGAKATRPETYRPPLWSWAVVDGKLESHRLDDANMKNFVADVLNVNAELLTENTTGQVTRRELCLRGHLTHFRVAEEPE